MSNKLTESKIAEMFGWYCEKQNYAWIAAKTGVHEKTVRNYCRNLNWPKRLANIRAKVADKQDESIAKMQSRHAALGQLLQARGAKRLGTAGKIQDGVDKDETAVKAIETGVRMEREARGEAGAITKEKLVIELVKVDGEQTENDFTNNDLVRERI